MELYKQVELVSLISNGKPMKNEKKYPIIIDSRNRWINMVARFTMNDKSFWYTPKNLQTFNYLWRCHMSVQLLDVADRSPTLIFNIN